MLFLGLSGGGGRFLGPPVLFVCPSASAPATWPPVWQGRSALAGLERAREGAGRRIWGPCLLGRWYPPQRDGVCALLIPFFCDPQGQPLQKRYSQMGPVFSDLVVLKGSPKDKQKAILGVRSLTKDTRFHEWQR